MKRIVSLLLVLTVLFSNFSFVAMGQIIGGQLQPIVAVEFGIRQTVESFFEEMDAMKFDDDLAVSELCDYFYSDKNDATQLTYAQISMLVLSQRELIEQQSHLLRQNQSYSYEYISRKELDDGLIEIGVQIIREWNYRDVKVASGSLDEYIVTLRNDDNNWRIISIEGLFDDFRREELASKGYDYTNLEDLTEYINNVETIVQEQVEAVYTSLQQDNVETMTSSAIVPASTTYNRVAATDYAYEYALTPNPAYYYYEKDCTNFISQCLYAGNIPMHYGSHYDTVSWYYRSSNDVSSC